MPLQEKENGPSDSHSYHGLVVEGKTLKLPQRVGGGGELFEDDEGLSPHLHGLHGHDFYYLTELREERVERTLHLCKVKTRSRQSSTQTLIMSVGAIYFLLVSSCCFTKNR